MDRYKMIQNSDGDRIATSTVTGMKLLAKRKLLPSGNYTGITPKGFKHQITLEVKQYVASDKKSFLNPHITVKKIKE